MFRTLASAAAANQVPDAATALVSLHPAELTALLEQAWDLQSQSDCSPDRPPRPPEQYPRTGGPGHPCRYWHRPICKAPARAQRPPSPPFSPTR